MPLLHTWFVACKTVFRLGRFKRLEFREYLLRCVELPLRVVLFTLLRYLD